MALETLEVQFDPSVLTRAEAFGIIRRTLTREGKLKRERDEARDWTRRLLHLVEMKGDRVLGLPDWARGE